jgi:ketosteroid isomerase-like protein
MTEQKMESIIRSFIEALVAADVEKALSFFTDDGTWDTPEGRFTGKDELRKYLTWFTQTVADLKVEETGIGILAKGDEAACEHTFTAKFRGQLAQVPVLCSWEFKGDKVQRLKSFYDRLALATQASRSWFVRNTVSNLAKRMEKGLR